MKKTIFLENEKEEKGKNYKKRHSDYMRDNLRQYMADNNITLHELAEKADIPFTTLQSIIYKGSDCRTESAAALARAIGISMDEMLNTGALPDETLLSLKKSRSLPHHRRLLIRRYIEMQCNLELIEKRNKSKMVSVMNLDYVNEHLCATEDFCAVDISEMSDDIKSVVFRGVRIPCNEYIQFYRENDVLLLSAERKPRLRERCVVLYYNRVFIVQREYRNGIWGFKGIRNEEIFLTESDIDFYFGYVVAVKHE